MSDQDRAAKVVTMGCFCVCFIGSLVCSFVFPGVSEWIGIYFGLLVWVFLGLALGSVGATSALSSKGDKYKVGGDSGGSGKATVCVFLGCLLGGVLFPIMVPLAMGVLAIASIREQYKAGEKPSKIAFVTFFAVIFVGGVTVGCFFGIAEIAVRLCVVNTDDVCVSGSHNGTMNLPSGMYLNPPSIWVLNQKPVSKQIVIQVT